MSGRAAQKTPAQIKAELGRLEHRLFTPQGEPIVRNVVRGMQLIDELLDGADEEAAPLSSLMDGWA